ncbi:MAG: hypothetical protein M1814_002081 [Vezdaea aestivalis]|nr:MAG: hypothetical protein M1814_002081 [Vezdaea aestivalis]
MPQKHKATLKKTQPLAKDTKYTSARDDQLKVLSRLIADTAPLPLKAKVQWLVQAFSCLVLAALFTSVSHLSLSPVYGDIPSSLYHSQLIAVAFLLGWAAQTPIRQFGLMDSVVFGIPLLAAWIPSLQFFLLNQSSYLGPLLGPLVTESLTLFPLLLMSICIATSPVQLVQISGSDHLTSASHAALGAVSYSIFNLLRNWFRTFVLQHAGSLPVLSRVVLQYITTGLYALLFPSKLLFFAIPSILHAAFLNTHIPLPYSTSLLESSLAAHSSYKMLARQDSVTGYISVLENVQDNFRVLRCDHSLLGGMWLQPPPGFEKTSKVKEPIYAVFTMTEAVRLVIREPASTQENCLIVGLGIGTSAVGMISHGIDTTVIEIDPLVHQYATDYFELPTNHTTVIQDAVQYVQSAQAANHQTYDYIIHDVFTGGAEPADLFTIEFLRGLHSLLKPNGVIALIYAGDIMSESARLVMRTIDSVLGPCRVFREDEASENVDADDFTNIVIFCNRGPSPPQFRTPVEADFLGSYSRQTYLAPRHEVEQNIFRPRPTDRNLYITQSNVEILRDGQKQSAIGHWKIMRTVLPDFVWQAW